MIMTVSVKLTGFDVESVLLGLGTTNFQSCRIFRLFTEHNQIYFTLILVPIKIFQGTLAKISTFLR